MQIIVDRKENSYSVAFALVFLTGSIQEPNNKSGITHLIEHMAFRKAKDKTQAEIYDYLERLGVKVDACTGRNFIKFSFVCRTDVFDKVLNLFHDMLYEFDYTESELKAEKAVVAAEIQERASTNRQIIIDETWLNKSYSKSILGTDKSLRRITLADLIDYKKKLLATDGAAFLIGNVGDAEYDSVKKLFGDLGTSRAEYSVADTERSRKSGRVKFIDDEYDLIDIYYAAHLRLSDKQRERDIVCLQMLNSALFQGDAAYVKGSVRERMGLIYEVDSTVRIIGNEAVMLFSLQVDKNKVVQCIETLERELNEFVYDEKYHAYIKAYFCDNVIMLQDNIKEKAEQYVYNYIDFGKAVSPERYGELVKSISFDEYNEVYKRLMSDRNVYVFGDVSGSQKRAIRKLCVK